MSEMIIKVESHDEARIVLSELEEMYPKLKWPKDFCKPTEYIPRHYTTLFIHVDTDTMTLGYFFYRHRLHIPNV